MAHSPWRDASRGRARPRWRQRAPHSPRRSASAAGRRRARPPAGRAQNRELGLRFSIEVPGAGPQFKLETTIRSWGCAHPDSRRLVRLGRFFGWLTRLARQVSLRAPAGGQGLAGAVKPALEALHAVGAHAALLARGLEVGPQVAQEVEHRALQLLHAVADDADVATALDAPPREVVTQRLLVGAEFDERLVDFVEVALVLLGGFLRALEMRAHRGFERDLPLAIGAPALLRLLLEVPQPGLCPFKPLRDCRANAVGDVECLRAQSAFDGTHALAQLLPGITGAGEAFDASEAIGEHAQHLLKLAQLAKQRFDHVRPGRDRTLATQCLER